MTQPPNSPPSDQGGYPDPAGQPPPPYQQPAEQFQNPAGAQPMDPGYQQGAPVGGAPAGGVTPGGMAPGGMNPGGMAPVGMNPGGMNTGGMNTGGMNPAPRAGSFDPATVAKGDWLVLGLGFLLFIFSFFGWQSVDLGPYGSVSSGGWNGWWVLIQLILLAVVVIKVVQIFTGNLRKEIPPIALAGAGGLLVLLYLIALITTFSSLDGVGPGFGIWACLILSIPFAYFLALSAQKEGALPFKVPGPAGF